MSKEPKWLYRLEATDPKRGLWYNNEGQFVLNIKEVPGNTTWEMPMGYDERYQQNGQQWFSSCSNKADLLYWYSREDAEKLVETGFVFCKYLAKDFVEYERETVFRKDTILQRLQLTVEEVMMSNTVNIKVRDLVALYGFLFILLLAVLASLNKQIQTDEQVRVLHNRVETLQVLVNNLYGEDGDE